MISKLIAAVLLFGTSSAEPAFGQVFQIDEQTSTRTIAEVRAALRQPAPSSGVSRAITSRAIVQPSPNRRRPAASLQSELDLVVPGKGAQERLLRTLLSKLKVRPSGESARDVALIIGAIDKLVQLAAEAKAIDQSSLPVKWRQMIESSLAALRDGDAERAASLLSASIGADQSPTKTRTRAAEMDAANLLALQALAAEGLLEPVRAAVLYNQAANLVSPFDERQRQIFMLRRANALLGAGVAGLNLEALSNCEPAFLASRSQQGGSTELDRIAVAGAAQCALSAATVKGQRDQIEATILRVRDLRDQIASAGDASLAAGLSATLAMGLLDYSNRYDDRALEAAIAAGEDAAVRLRQARSPELWKIEKATQLGRARLAIRNNDLPAAREAVNIYLIIVNQRPAEDAYDRLITKFNLATALASLGERAQINSQEMRPLAESLELLLAESDISKFPELNLAATIAYADSLAYMAELDRKPLLFGTAIKIYQRALTIEAPSPYFRAIGYNNMATAYREWGRISSGDARKYYLQQALQNLNEARSIYHTLKSRDRLAEVEANIKITSRLLDEN